MVRSMLTQLGRSFIFEEFGPIFRRKANIDPFLRTVGVADYVNAILIFELTVMLIMKDMRVNEKTARDIFYRSATFEELLNADTNTI